MPEELIRRLFEELAAEPVPVPSPDAVLARGRRRRHRALVRVAVCLAVLLGGTGIGLWRFAASQAGGPRALAAGRVAWPTTLLGVSDGRFYLARYRSVTPLAGYVPAGDGAFGAVASDPAGGWVIAYIAVAATGTGSAIDRLALVGLSGAVHPFGAPLPAGSEVTALAVSPDGTRVAVALARVPTGTGDVLSASITVLPMPGTAGQAGRWQARTWSVGGQRGTMVASLAWQGRSTTLAYLTRRPASAGLRSSGTARTEVGSFDVSALTTSLVTAGTWPGGAASGTVPHCAPEAIAWLTYGHAGKSGLLELGRCAGQENLGFVSAASGAPVGPSVVVPGLRCQSPAISAGPGGLAAIVSFCGSYEFAGGALVRIGGSFSQAALPGVTGQVAISPGCRTLVRCY